MNHPIDLGAALVLRLGPDHVRFFAGGWGDDALLHPPDPASIPDVPLPIRWLTHEDHGDIRMSHGSFTSPAPGLPDRARQGSAVRILPMRKPGRIVVLMPAWNEHDPKVRIDLAVRLAAKGIGSIVLENAYFGSRRPGPARGHPIRTVADFMVMGASAVIEAMAILSWLRTEYRRIGVSGYSMGGNTAALVAASVPFPVAAAPLAASHSPAPVFLDGVLRYGIAWDALGGEAQAWQLREVLGRASVLRLTPAPHLSHAVIVAARSDAYIPRRASEDLARHWPGCELRFEPGGHATLVWLHKDRLARAVWDAFERFG